MSMLPTGAHIGSVFRITESSIGLRHPDDDEHFHFVISRAINDQVVVVSMTTWREETRIAQDGSCILLPKFDKHECIEKKSYIYYRKCQFRTIETFHAYNVGQFIQRYDDCPIRTLDRILDGASTSNQLPKQFKDILKVEKDAVHEIIVRNEKPR